jgi:hypothetical protein
VCPASNAWCLCGPGYGLGILAVNLHYARPRTERARVVNEEASSARRGDRPAGSVAMGDRRVGCAVRIRRRACVDGFVWVCMYLGMYACICETNAVDEVRGCLQR